MEVTYTTTRADLWRCSTYASILWPKQMAKMLLLVLAWVGTLFYQDIRKLHHPLSLAHAFTIVAVTCVSVAGLFTLVTALWIFVVMKHRSSKPVSQRGCTTRISPNGVQDVTPERDHLLLWKDVEGIRIQGGDIFFWNASRNIIVPRGAFPNLSEAREFYQHAIGLWENRSHQLDAAAVSRFTVAGLVNEGDVVLWSGQPNPSAFAKSRISIMPVMLQGMAVLLTSVMIVGTGFLLWEFMLGTWVCVLGFYPLLTWDDQKKARKIYYLLTDTRILISEQQGVLAPTYVSITLEEVERVKYWNRPLGTATFKFGTATKSVDFDSIDNPVTVIDLIATARGQKPTDVEALFASRPNSDPFLSILRQEENLLWQGQPDRTAYSREFWGSWGGIVFYPILLWLFLLSLFDFTAPPIHLHPQPLWEKLAILTPFMLLGAGLIMRRYRERVNNSTTIVYAVTNQRLLLLDQRKPQFFAEADLGRVQKMKYEERASGIGTLSYGGKYGNDLEFEFLTDAHDVRRIIDEAAQKISGKAVDWVNLSATRAN